MLASGIDAKVVVKGGINTKEFAKHMASTEFSFVLGRPKLKRSHL